MGIDGVQDQRDGLGVILRYQHGRTGISGGHAWVPMEDLNGAGRLDVLRQGLCHQFVEERGGVLVLVETSAEIMEKTK